jgi:regulator of RNase E activity RraA
MSDVQPIQALKGYRTPIVSDALEYFGTRARTIAYTDATIRSILPALGAFVGYACTGKVMAETPEEPQGAKVPWPDVWRYVQAQPAPSFMVCQDLDQPAGKGCAWGDVSAATFTRLGCVAVLTNGAVRDIHAVEEIGFGLFAATAVVGHANIRFVEIGTTVKVGGLLVRPGDLIHADDHGAVIIPREIPLDALVATMDRHMAAERSVIDYALKAPDFSIDGLTQRMDDLHALASSHFR